MNAKKSYLLAVILTGLFGGFGVFYVSTVGGIIMAIAEVVVLLLAIVTLGLGFVLVPVVHINSLVRALVGVSQTK